MIADLGKDGEILLQAREAAVEILENDAELTNSEHQPIKNQLNLLRKTTVNWAKIS